MPLFTGFGANMTLTGLHNSSSCPGRTDKHSDISIWLASVHTPCESNRLVRSRQFCAAMIRNKLFNEIRNFVIAKIIIKFTIFISLGDYTFQIT